MRRKFVVGLVLVIVLAWSWIALRPGPEEQLADLIAELRARGEPVSLAEMEPPMPPDDGNGAHDLDAALEWWEENEPEGDWGSRTAGPWNYGLVDVYADASPEQLQALDELLAHAEPFFAHVDRGVEKPEIAWPLADRHTAAGVIAFLDRTQPIEELGRFLDARATRGVTETERRRAIRSQLLLGARIRARTPLESIYASKVFAGGCRHLREALAERRIDPLLARQSLDAALREHWDGRFPEMVRAARAHQLEAIPFWIDGTLRQVLELPPPPTAWDRLQEGLQQLLKGRWRFADRESPAARVRWTRDLEHFLEPGLSFDETIDVMSRLRHNQIAFILPRIREKHCEIDVQSALARIALAAYEHRHRVGDWPASPDELAELLPGGVPVDAFSGEPFTFERDGDGLVLRAKPRREPFFDEDPFEEGLEWRLPPRD